MLISVNKTEEVVTIRAGGIIDERVAVELKNKLAEIDISSISSIIIDFQELTYIGSAGIGQLLHLYKKVAKTDISIRMINLPEAFYDLFLQLHFDSLFTIEMAEPMD